MHIALPLVLAAIAGCTTTPELMPTPNIYLQGDGYPKQAVPHDLRSNDVDLLFVTDRAPETATDVTTTVLRELIIEARAAGRNPRESYRIEILIMAAHYLDFDVVRQRLMTE